MVDALTEVGRDGGGRAGLAGEWGLARFDFYEEIDSTQNALRALADTGAAAWTLVAADYQNAGRGQHGRRWEGAAGASLAFSLLVRPNDMASAALLPIRTGLAVARALDGFLQPPALAMLKWPNDIIVAGGKVAGVLCEAQTRGDDIAVIVGVGLNVAPFAAELDENRYPPIGFLGAHIVPGTTRLDLLAAIVQSLRATLLTGAGELQADEMRDYARRDWLHGRSLTAPARGVAQGITRNGLLRVATRDGAITTIANGSVKCEV